MVGSITDDPIQLREFRYLKPTKVSAAISGHACEKIALVFHDRHAIQHVHERGYVESPVRVRSILTEIAQGTLFDILPAATFPEKAIASVRDVDFINLLRRPCAEIKEDTPWCSRRGTMPGGGPSGVFAISTTVPWPPNP